MNNKYLVLAVSHEETKNIFKFITFVNHGFEAVHYTPQHSKLKLKCGDTYEAYVYKPEMTTISGKEYYGGIVSGNIFRKYDRLNISLDCWLNTNNVIYWD